MVGMWCAGPGRSNSHCFSYGGWENQSNSVGEKSDLLKDSNVIKAGMTITNNKVITAYYGDEKLPELCGDYRKPL